MRNLIFVLLALTVGVGLGAGGLYTSQRLADGGESAECKAWNERAKSYLLYDAPPDEVDAYLTATDKALDIRYKACHP